MNDGSTHSRLYQLLKLYKGQMSEFAKDMRGVPGILMVNQIGANHRLKRIVAVGSRAMGQASGETAALHKRV